MRRIAWVVWALWLSASCVAVTEDMRRAEAAFDEARYEDVEVWLSALEKDLVDMDRTTRARFYYLRGTTAYRLHEARDARHYLALAREESLDEPGALRPQWRREMARMLEELSQPESAGGEQTEPQG